ncbi:MAG: ATP-binding protein [Cyanobacteria bacterium J06627_28]
MTNAAISNDEKNSEDAISSAESGQYFLSQLKVNRRILTGFALALGLSFGGVGTGILVGNFYQDSAFYAEEYSLTKSILLSELQASVLQTRTHQQQLIPLTETPDDFREEYSHILKHSESIETLWADLATFMGVLESSGFQDEETLAETREFLATYDGVSNTYLSELNKLVESIDLDSLDSPEKLEDAQRTLLAFTNSELAIEFDGISDSLSGMIKEANAKTDVARAGVRAAQQLRNRIIVLSMLLATGVTTCLAILIARSINRPLDALAKTAEKISENDQFDLRADVIGNDEVSTVARAFNLLLKRAEDLMLEQKLRGEELEKTNKKLVSTRSQMIAQEKLASLGSLTAGIAHEIKNPLNFVNNFAELSVELTQELAEEFESQKEQLEPDFVEEVLEILRMLQENVSKIDIHGKRADKIVANMLQHSRNGESEWTAVNINELVAEAINLAYHGMRAKQSDFNLDFDNDYDDSIGMATVSAQDLNRVFLNIASNACYAIYQRQLTEGPDFKPLLKVRTRKQDDNIVIHIRDNGHGMSPEVKAKVFDQFFTTKPTGEGTGLGLSLSHNIVVEQHKGTMDVESVEGLYTDFIITIPT